MIHRLPLSTLLALGVICACAGDKTAAPVRGFAEDALDSLARIESVLRATPDSARVREYVRIMSEDPHHAGSPGARAVAGWALQQFRAWGLDAQIEEFDALLPTPISRSVELVSPARFVARMQEPVLADDKDSGDKGQLPTYNAYGADGDVTGELVFANYGNEEDFVLLDSMRIDLRGKIVMVKYGRGVRSAKIKQAVARGAVGCIIYSDPEEDGPSRGEVYPGGPWRPADAVQRGTALDYAAMYAGDPLTPGWGSTKGTRRLTRAEAKSLPTIPVIPLSWGDARPLLEALGGTVAPDDNWKGGLPITYHIGPGPARVRLTSKSDWKTGPLYNVVGRIPGASLPDEWVILANHHDGWVNGARDPVSGAAALMEAVRSLSQLLQRGWRPERTIIFALWDGEEWGLLGSTEWAEAHAEELREKAVAYFNTDTYSKGPFGAVGSHTLQTFVTQVTRDLRDPATGRSALDVAMAPVLASARTMGDSSAVRQRGFALGVPGSGTDFEPFLEHLGIATISHGFEGGPGAGVYHSIYDSYDHFSRFMDPGFAYGAAQATADAVLAVRMADASLLPFSFSDAAMAYRGFALEAQALATRFLGTERLDLGPVLQSVERLETAGRAFDSAAALVMQRGSAYLRANHAALDGVNADLYRSERDLSDSAGLPGREWFKSMMYATGVFTGFAGDPMPGVVQTIRARRTDAAAGQVRRVSAAIDRMALRAARATEALRRVGR